MNLRSALGPADPAKRLPPTTPDEDLLASILSTDSAALPEPADEHRTRKHARHERRPLIVTAAVAAAVAAVAAIAIQVAPSSPPAPASTAPSQAALENAVFARLNEVATGDVPVREKSATTWSSTTQSADGGAIDLTGRNLYIAAACAGGGAIAIKVSGHKDRTLDCGTLSTLGPINLTAEIGSASQTADLNVVVLAGSPHYVAKSMAFPMPPAPTPSTTTTPSTPTACKPSDFQITAHLEGTVMNYTQSPVTLIQDAGHPCTLTSAFVLDTIRNAHRVAAARLSLASIVKRGYPLAPAAAGSYVLSPGTRLALRITGTPTNAEAGVGTYNRAAWLRINNTYVRLDGDLPANVVDHGVTLTADPR